MNKKNSDFTATITVNKNSKEAFDAILNLRGWWSEEIDGSIDELNEIFSYHYQNIHLSKMKLVEKTPNKKIVWRVVDNFFNFIKDQNEWKDTLLVFELVEQAGETIVTFTHEGLTSAYECYDVCFDAWTGYIKNSLKNFIDTGKGNPNPKEGDGFNLELARKWNLEAQTKS